MPGDKLQSGKYSCQLSAFSFQKTGKEILEPATQNLTTRTRNGDTDGDFRVQEEYGGTSTLTEAPEYLIEQAQHLLETAVSASHTQTDILYARIDGLDINGRFVLMELELIEPYLFLIFKEGAVEKFAQKLVEAINLFAKVDNG